MTAACSEALGLATMSRDLGDVNERLAVHVDASAAVGVAQRKGLGVSGNWTRNACGLKEL